MHLISFRVDGRDGLAAWRGCPFTAVKTWQTECDARAAELGVPAPQVMITARRPTTADEVDALRAAGIPVHEFAGWDQMPVRVPPASEPVGGAASAGGSDAPPAAARTRRVGTGG